MNIHLVTGGARSGKSRFGEQLATRLGGSVTYIATAEALDDEMSQRIALHRSNRPPGWSTVEVPHEAHAAVCAAPTDVLLLDCLTMLVSNVFLASSANYSAALEAVAKETSTLLAAANERAGELIVVTNEVGFGIVPERPLGRWFRDALGRANQALAEQAATVTLVVSGIPVRIK